MNSRQIAKALGRRGGRMRALRLSARERKRIASLGGKARATSLQAAWRIAVNLRYAAILQALRCQSTDVRRRPAFGGPLPDILPSHR